MSIKVSQETKSSKKVVRKVPKVYVVDGGYDYIRMMWNFGCEGAKDVDSADIVLFTGGEDVSPMLYGQAPLIKTHFNSVRDDREELIFEAALRRGLPMVGICRGGQFLNVCNRGKMWQHVNNHTGDHIIQIQVEPFGEKGVKRTALVTSTHHQMMIPGPEATILATAGVCTEKQSPDEVITGRSDDDPDIEVLFYEKTNCLCFQPHPEYRSAPPECVDFFEECLDNFIFPRTEIK